MDYPEDDSTDELIDTFCVGCDLPFAVNDLGLCDNCFAKLERDLIRSRDWAYSITAFGVAPDQLEALRERVIRDHSAAYELIESPKSRTNAQSHAPARTSVKSQHRQFGTTIRMMSYRRRVTSYGHKTRNG